MKDELVQAMQERDFYRARACCDPDNGRGHTSVCCNRKKLQLEAFQKNGLLGLEVMVLRSELNDALDALEWLRPQLRACSHGRTPDGTASTASRDCRVCEGLGTRAGLLRKHGRKP